MLCRLILFSQGKAALERPLYKYTPFVSVFIVPINIDVDTQTEPIEYILISLESQYRAGRDTPFESHLFGETDLYVKF